MTSKTKMNDFLKIMGITLLIIFVISVLSFIIFLSIEKTDNPTFTNNLSVNPLLKVTQTNEIHFYAQHIAFTDNTLNITWSNNPEGNGLYLNFDNISRMIWTQGNKTWTYIATEDELLIDIEPKQKLVLKGEPKGLNYFCRQGETADDCIKRYETSMELTK